VVFVAAASGGDESGCWTGSNCIIPATHKSMKDAMSQLAVSANSDAPGSREPSTASAFDKLQQLTRQGYVPDPQPLSDGILLRHPSGPELILRPDGSLDLPTGKTARRSPNALSGLRRGISWRRSFLFLLVLAVGIILGWIFTALVFTS
jgi:hypothetical protein